MLPEPLRTANLIELMIGKLKHGSNNLGLLGHNLVAVHNQKNDARQESGTFVAVDKAMVWERPAVYAAGQIK